MTEDRARANGQALRRRAILTALPAAGAALALPIVASARPEPVIEYLRQWRAAQGDLKAAMVLDVKGNGETPECLAAYEQLNHWSNRICHYRPTSIAGLQAQLEYALEDFKEALTGIVHYPGADTANPSGTLFENMLAGARAMVEDPRIGRVKG